MAYDKVVDSAALETKLRDIGDAIREKTGKNELIDIDYMPDEIRSIADSFDFSAATVTPKTLSYGVTAYDANGDLISGTLGEYDYILTPQNESDEGLIAPLILPVNAGDVITITFYPTRYQGYVYDGRFIGLQYYGSVYGGNYPLEVINIEQTVTITAASSGRLGISGNREDENGVVQHSDDCIYGKYIKVKVTQAGGESSQEKSEGLYCWRVSDEKITLSSLVPTMTSNTVGQYELLGSSMGNINLYFAFDRNPQTYWMNQQGAPYNLGVKFPEPITITSFSVQNHGSYYTSAVKEFSLEYSDDGNEWFSLETYVNPTTANAITMFTVTTPIKKQYWRLHISTTYYGSTSMACTVVQIEFYSESGTKFVISDIPDAYPQDGFAEDGKYYLVV